MDKSGSMLVIHYVLMDGHCAPDTKSLQTHSNTGCLKRYDEHVVELEKNYIGRYVGKL